MSDKDIAKDRADWLLDAVAGATQNRQFLRGDPAYDEVAGVAILLNGEKAINVALSKKNREITRLRAALADAQAVGFAAGVEAAKTAVSLNAWAHRGDDAYSKGMDAGARHQNEQDLAAIRALAPPDATAAAARVLLPIMEQQHIDYITSLGRDPGKYTSEYSMVAKSLRAIAGDTP